jgi:hypothetical protein
MITEAQGALAAPCLKFRSSSSASTSAAGFVEHDRGRSRDEAIRLRRVGVVEEVAAAHYAATDEPIGTAVAQTSSRPRRAPR